MLPVRSVEVSTLVCWVSLGCGRCLALVFQQLPTFLHCGLPLARSPCASSSVRQVSFQTLRGVTCRKNDGTHNKMANQESSISTAIGKWSACNLTDDMDGNKYENADGNRARGSVRVYGSCDYFNRIYCGCDATSEWKASWCYVLGGTDCHGCSNFLCGKAKVPVHPRNTLIFEGSMR